MNSLKKIEKIQSIICCPHCHGEISFKNASRNGTIVLAAEMDCVLCGPIGKVVNAKFVFNDNCVLLSGEANDVLGELRQETYGPQVASCSPSNGWQAIDDFFLADRPGAKITINTLAIGVDLYFLKHDWSGIVDISVNGKIIHQLSLFEANGGIVIAVPIFLGKGNHKIEVILTNRKPETSKATQCIFKGFSELLLTEGNSAAYYTEASNLGNPYSAAWDSMVDAVQEDALILDCGSGDRKYPDSRVVNFEYCAFGLPDVFGDGHRLPFKDNVFDLILSQAVVEHLYDPLQAGREIYRVTKPGGRVYVESAFMQPQHAVPSHYFNTTKWGLAEIFKQFSIENINCAGALGDTISWIYRLTQLEAKGFGQKVNEVERLIRELDEHITPEELAYFASFVTLTAKKTE